MYCTDCLYLSAPSVGFASLSAGCRRPRWCHLRAISRRAHRGLLCIQLFSACCYRSLSLCFTLILSLFSPPSLCCISLWRASTCESEARIHANPGSLTLHKRSQHRQLGRWRDYVRNRRKTAVVSPEHLLCKLADVDFVPLCVRFRQAAIASRRTSNNTAYERVSSRVKIVAVFDSERAAGKLTFEFLPIVIVTLAFMRPVELRVHMKCQHVSLSQFRGTRIPRQHGSPVVTSL